MTKKFLSNVATYQPGAQTLPGKYYTSESIFSTEKEKLFAQHWNCVGRSSDVSKPGDYFLATVVDESLIIVRDSKGALHAHFNVCRHRGTRMCEALSGNLGKAIQCPYHAWTYTTDGKLVAAPFMEEVKDFEKPNYGLHQAGVAEWEGFIFVNIAEKPEPFEKAWAPMMGRLSRFKLENLQLGHEVTYTIKGNWKLVFQNYNECLHCPTIHPTFSAVLPYKGGAHDLVEGSHLGGYMEITPPNTSATMTGKACGVPVGPKKERMRAYYYTFMPNFIMSIHPDYVNFYLVYPISPNETRVESQWLFHPDTLKDPKNNIQDAIEFWDVTNRQDWDIVEKSQLGIASRRYTPGPYSANESIPAAWDREYLRLMKE